MNESTTEPAPIGLLGGTFDPIHCGHLRLAVEAHQSIGLEVVTFIPVGEPPHRDAPGTPARERLELVRIGTRGNPAFTIDDGEVNTPGKSYTVLTLERVRQRIGAARSLVLILGADAFEGLHKWHRWNELFDLCHIAVASRPGSAPHGRPWPGVLAPELDQACRGRIDTDFTTLRHTPAGRIVPFGMTPLAISASLIRELIRTGRSPRYLLPDSVLDYIDSHDLYR